MGKVRGEPKKEPMPFLITFKGDKFLKMLKGDKELMKDQNNKPVYEFPSFYEITGMNGKWGKFQKVDLEKDLGLAEELVTKAKKNALSAQKDDQKGSEKKRAVSAKPNTADQRW